MTERFPITIGRHAVEEAARFCTAGGLRRLILVADENTHAALGARLLAALEAAGCQVRLALLAGDEVIADAARILEVLVAAEEQPDAFLAVGSGTVTDITRFVSHRSGRPFLSLPTAPSVDGYASVSAPIVIGRFKRTVPAQGPAALFADLPTLCAAPRGMIAAGFGDMLGKYTSLADWRLSHLIWGDRYDEAVAARTRAALERTVASAAAIGAAQEEGIASLMRALIDSGSAMLDFQDSRPASGSEHHLSHFGRCASSWRGARRSCTGPRWGLAACGWGAGSRRWPRWAATRPVAGWRPPRRRSTTRNWPASAASLAPPPSRPSPTTGLPGLSAERHAALCARIVDRWDEVLAACRSVPPVAEMAALLGAVGGATTPEGLASARRRPSWPSATLTICGRASRCSSWPVAGLLVGAQGPVSASLSAADGRARPGRWGGRVPRWCRSSRPAGWRRRRGSRHCGAIPRGLGKDRLPVDELWQAGVGLHGHQGAPRRERRAPGPACRR